MYKRDNTNELANELENCSEAG